MKQILLIATFLTLVSCGQKSSSSKKSCTYNDQAVDCSTMNPQASGSEASNSEAIYSIEGLKQIGLTFEEIGHRTYEYQYGVVCTDNIKFTNQDRLNNLDEILRDMVLKNRTHPKAKYRVYCNYGEDKCLLSGPQLVTLIKEAIGTLNKFSFLLPSKYCPNNNLTPNGIVISH